MPLRHVRTSSVAALAAAALLGATLTAPAYAGREQHPQQPRLEPFQREGEKQNEDRHAEHEQHHGGLAIHRAVELSLRNPDRRRLTPSR